MDKDITDTTTTELTNAVDNFSVASQNLDDAQIKETRYSWTDFTKYNGYFKEIPELHQAILGLAIYVAGKGWKAETSLTKAILDSITGWGEDTFQSIMENMIMVKKINGDAFAEIIRSDKGTLINIKPLNPARMTVVTSTKGIIKKYEYASSKPNGTPKNFKPEEIFHICNDRVGNEIHGSSVVESCLKIIDARNEAMDDWKRILHRSTIRVLYVDEDDPAKLSLLSKQYKEAIKSGEVLILPGNEKDMKLADHTTPSDQPFLNTIRYYENFFYQAVGVSKSILGGTQDFTESSSKMSVFTFDQIWMREQRELEGDLWNQLAIKVSFIRPNSLKDELTQDEAKDTGQTGVQPNDVQPAAVTPNE